MECSINEAADILGIAEVRDTVTGPEITFDAASQELLNTALYALHHTSQIIEIADRDERALNIYRQKLRGLVTPEQFKRILWFKIYAEEDANPNPKFKADVRKQIWFEVAENEYHNVNGVNTDVDQETQT